MTAAFPIRPLCAADDAAVAAVIRRVMPEFGAGGTGFAIQDAEVGCMCVACAQPRRADWALDTC